MADFMEKAMDFVSDKVEKPEADITDFDLKKVSMDSISYHAKVAVKNPYSVPVPIMQISYTLKCSGRYFFFMRVSMFPRFWVIY